MTVFIMSSPLIFDSLIPINELLPIDREHMTLMKLSKKRIKDSQLKQIEFVVSNF